MTKNEYAAIIAEYLKNEGMLNDALSTAVALGKSEGPRRYYDSEDEGDVKAFTAELADCAWERNANSMAMKLVGFLLNGGATAELSFFEWEGTAENGYTVTYEFRNIDWDNFDWVAAVSENDLVVEEDGKARTPFGNLDDEDDLMSLKERYRRIFMEGWNQNAQNEANTTEETKTVTDDEETTIDKLNDAVRNVLNVFTTIKEDGIEVDYEQACDSLLLLKEFREVAIKDVPSLVRKLEEYRRDGNIVQKVEAIRKSFQCGDERAAMNNTVEELRNFVKLQNGEGSSMTLSAAAVFAAIHQTCDDLEIDYELFDDKSSFDANRWGLNDSYRFFYRVDYGGSEGIYLDMWLERNGDKTDLATIKTLREDKDAFRVMSALGCEYSLAFKTFPNLHN